MKPINESTQELIFWIKGNSRWINVTVKVEEFDDGRLIISTKYGTESVGKRDTSIDNSDIVSTYGSGT